MARAKRHYIPGYIWHITHRCHKREFLLKFSKDRHEEWTESIAVGSRFFVEKVKALLGFRAKGRDVMEGPEGHQAREGSPPYNALFGAEKDDIGPKNTYFWDINAE